ncbi:DUF1259 domain-containing protein [Paenibacillus sp. P25]|nr:DUF1259 domain-containing protein [Paenibacillus sp. P25]
MKKLLLPVLGLMLILPFGAAGAKETGDCAGLKRIFPSGVSEENGVCKLDIPRKGLEVRHTGASMSPAMMELAFMANFEKSGPHSAVMGNSPFWKRK